MQDDPAASRTRLEHSHTREEIQERLAREAQGNYLRDWVYGGIDGTDTTFGVVAEGLAMGAGNYSATKAELDDYRRLLAVERKHIALEPGGEREEIRQIFGLKGFSGAELERIVD